jgi:hypothetical protein
MMSPLMMIPHISMIEKAVVPAVEDRPLLSFKQLDKDQGKVPGLSHLPLLA